MTVKIVDRCGRVSCHEDPSIQHINTVLFGHMRRLQLVKDHSPTCTYVQGGKKNALRYKRSGGGIKDQKRGVCAEQAVLETRVNTETLDQNPARQ